VLFVFVVVFFVVRFIELGDAFVLPELTAADCRFTGRVFVFEFRTFAAPRLRVRFFETTARWSALLLRAVVL